MNIEQLAKDNPNDRKIWSAYADWLMERNDIRGEYISFHLNYDQIEDTIDIDYVNGLRKKMSANLNTYLWLGDFPFNDTLAGIINLRYNS